MKDLDYLKANNLALGASLEMPLVWMKPGSLMKKVYVSRTNLYVIKFLDAVGDLYLLGHQIIAKFDGYKSGHALNNQLLRNVKSDPSCYEIVTFDDEANCPIMYVNVT